MTPKTSSKAFKKDIKQAIGPTSLFISIGFNAVEVVLAAGVAAVAAGCLVPVLRMLALF